MTGLFRIAALAIAAGAACSVCDARQDSGVSTHGEPVIIPPGGPGSPPFNGPFAPPIPLDFDDGSALTYDQGEAPDFAPLCDTAALGFFPTRPNSPSASGGRAGPRHTDVSEAINVILGRSVTHEGNNFSPQCDWLSTGCDLGDDGLMLLCLDPECNAGIMISRGTCGLGMGASFGAAPPVATPSAFFVARTHTGEDYIGSNFLNIAADINADGTMLDFPESWSLRDSFVQLRNSHSQIHRTASFPLITFSAQSADNWSVASFWTRLMVSEEPITSITALWDGSGRAFPYQWGETEDWLIRTQQGRWLCRLPESSVRTTLHAVVSLDPNDTQALAGTEFTIDSTGRPAGKVRQFRESTLQPGQPMPVEITSLNVRGNIPALGGTVNFRERSDRLSLGIVDVYQSTAGALVDGDLFLDISFAIDLLDVPRTLDTGAAFVRVEVPGIGAFPPAGIPMLPRNDAEPIALIDRATLQIAGWMRVISIEFTEVTTGGCSGDANNDGVIDFADVSAVLGNWGQPGASGDASGDCAVDFIDLTAVLANWNSTCQ